MRETDREREREDDGPQDKIPVPLMGNNNNYHRVMITVPEEGGEVSHNISNTTRSGKNREK